MLLSMESYVTLADSALNDILIYFRALLILHTEQGILSFPQYL